MIRFKHLRIRSQLAILFVLVLLPFLASEAITIGYFSRSLKETSERELTNVVRHLLRAVELQSQNVAHGPLPFYEASSSDPERPGKDVLHFLTEVFLSFRVGKTGYPYVIDSKGTLIIHPAKTGQNIIDSLDSKGFAFIRAITARAGNLKAGEVGTIRYPWRNVEEGEKIPRMKVLKYMYFKKWDWIVAAGAYEEEVYGVLDRIELYMTAFFAASVLLVVLFTLAMNRLIARPVVNIAQAAERMAEGDLLSQVSMPVGGHEIAVLSRSFNWMADQVREKTENLEAAVEERTRALKESRERYRNLVENTVDGIVTADLKGVITFANSGMEGMLGVGREKIIGRPIWGIYEGGIDQARKIMHVLRKEGNVTSYEMQLLGPDGAIPIRTSASILRDAEGHEMGTLGIFSDITKVKQLEGDLKKAQAHLIQSMKLRALGDLVAGVAHEINNPLMASTTMLHVLDKELQEQGPSLLPRVEILRRCNHRITKIVNHLREFSRQTIMEMEVIDPNLPVDNALLISAQQLMNNGIQIEKELTEGLPAVLADPNQLEQVFLDLIANARDALENVDGDRRLKAATGLTDLDGQPAVGICISDSGPGIPKEIQDKIFEPFYTTKDVGKGTGLGLSICYGIIEEHRGRIDVDSSPGEGTTFTIRLPLADLSVNGDAKQEDGHEL